MDNGGRRTQSQRQHGQTAMGYEMDDSKALPTPVAAAAVTAASATNAIQLGGIVNLSKLEGILNSLVAKMVAYTYHSLLIFIRIYDNVMIGSTTITNTEIE
jgi:hypothetical protein